MLPASFCLLLACLCGIIGTSAKDVTSDCEEPSLVQLKQDQDLTGDRRRRHGGSRRRRSASSSLPYILQVYCGDSWLTECSDVPSGWQQHNGAFDPDIATTPPAATADSDPDNNYITLGGGGVEGTIPNASTIEGWFSSANSNNLDFDMEGVLDYAYSTVETLTQQIQSTYPDAKAQVTCMVSEHSTAKKYKDAFDYFGIMIHGSSMTSGQYSIPCGSGEDPKTGGTWTWIEKWLDSDIPNSKIILSLTTEDLTACMVDWFKSLISEYGLAGMSFWAWNQLDSSISQSCIASQTEQCDSSDAYSCSAVCTGGDAEGACCDKGLNTSIGNCTILGQEGCCGGTDSTTYCQAN